MREVNEPVPSVISSIAAYPRATIVFLSIVAVLLGVGAAADPKHSLASGVITIFALLLLLLSAKLFGLLIFRVSRNGHVMRGDGKHFAAIIAIAFSTFIIWAVAMNVLGE